MRNQLFKSILDNAPKETDVFVEKYTSLVLRINQILKEKGISQKQLADSMDKKPSEISRWLSGGQNLTLRSIAKLEAELGETLIEIPNKVVSSQYKDLSEISFYSFSLERNTEKVEKKKNINTNSVLWESVIDQAI